MRVRRGWWSPVAHGSGLSVVARIATMAAVATSGPNGAGGGVVSGALVVGASDGADYATQMTVESHPGGASGAPSVGASS